MTVADPDKITQRAIEAFTQDSALDASMNALSASIDKALAKLDYASGRVTTLELDNLALRDVLDDWLAAVDRPEVFATTPDVARDLQAAIRRTRKVLGREG